MPKKPDPPQLYTVKQAAKILGCSVKTVERLYKTGELPVIRFRRSVRIDHDDLMEFRNKHRVSLK